MNFVVRVVLTAWMLCVSTVAWAESLTIATVSRTPFSMEDDTGFSMDIWTAVANRNGYDYEIRRFDTFKGMLNAAKSGEVDAAIANISITASREREMDFSQPIFDAGLQIMVPANQNAGASVWSVLFSAEIGLAILGAFAALFGMGMLMWLMERGAQPYFDRTAKQAMFPSFWWALNLVVNGGFEERVPQTFFGRIFGTLMVVSSLFIVSIFVANLTAAMTVEAISGSINSVDDLYGKRVATIQGSTSAEFLNDRGIAYSGYKNLDALLDSFEAGRVAAVVFDAPILAYYCQGDGAGKAELVGQKFLSENYGIALPSGSPLREDINFALLSLREDGTYDEIRAKWFGRSK